MARGTPWAAVLLPIGASIWFTSTAMVLRFLVATGYPSGNYHRHELTSTPQCTPYWPLSIIGAWGILLAVEPLRQRFSQRIHYALLVISVIPLSIISWFFWQPSDSLAEGFLKTHITFMPEMDNVSRLLQTQFADVPEVWIQDAGLNQPQIFIMLFQRWDPRTLARDHEFQENPKGWYRTTRLGRYHVCQYGDCPVEKSNVIFVEFAYHTNLGSKELARVPIRSVKRPGLAWVISGN